MSLRALSVRFTTGRWPVCLFWTFTFPTCQTYEEGAKKWDRLRRRMMREWSDAPLVRVFEMHPGGHGLHIHAVTPHWLSIRTMLRHGKACGFGRIHVVKWEDGNQNFTAGDYCAKYLDKARPASLKHKRLVGFINIPEDQATHQRDIRFCSPMVDIWAILKSHPEWGVMRFREKAFLARQVHRAWVNYDAPEAFQPAAEGGRLESLYLVITETIRRGAETIAAHLGEKPILSPSARLKLIDRPAAEHENGNWRAFHARHSHNQPSIEHEIRAIEDELAIERIEAGNGTVGDGRRAGIECPF